MEVPVDSAPLPREGHHSSSTPSSSVTILEDHHRHLQLEQLQRMHDLQMTEISALETALSTYTADVADVVDDAPAEAATEGAAELPAAVGAASSPSTISLESTMQDLQREVNHAASDVRTAQQRFQKQQQDDLERFQREETALVAKMARLVKVLDEAKQKVETEKEARRQEEIEAERVAEESRRLQFEDSLTRQSVTITLSSDRLNKLQAAMEKLRLSKQPSSVASVPVEAQTPEKAPIAAMAAPPATSEADYHRGSSINEMVQSA
ncbi:Hypothetical protein, putative [Bodo saltans]|uniref:Uncharacterized protein n=1 Tax=Bodo saltans TaxID=75058 RepID=A0A0S4KK05_BODSA|nr:Hypothetical protein, putative [Bodo saltans]|eukprot:CUI14885.1 Hypothetical protein, putative [Bodo saltans]